MENNNQKTCKVCYQSININAKRCPYCRHWQYKWATIFYHPIMAVLPIVLVFILMPVLISHLFSQGKDFERYKNQIQITQSKLNFGEVEGCPKLIILGTLKNNSNVAWKEIQLEVRFYGKEGKLFDTGQTNEFIYILQPNSEAPFKISLKRRAFNL